MENRFSAKDLLFATLLLALIGIVLLAMFQFDRQWDTLKRVESQLGQQGATQVEQGRALAGIQSRLQSGVALAGGGSPSTMPTADFASAKGQPFAAQLAAMAKPDYASGDWLVQNFPVKVSQLTPLLSSDIYARFVQNRIVEPLAYRDPNTLAWQPLLATDWSISDDGLTIDVKLRHGVQFSDGSPFTAEDITWGIDFVRNPDVNAPRDRAAYEPLDRCEKVNDFEVKFVFKRPYFESLAVALGTSPMSKAFYSKYTPKQFNESVGLLIGTGPYRMPDPAGWKPGTPIQLVRNERYWGPPPPFNKLYWREVEEDAAKLTMFRNGEIDSLIVQPEQFDAIKNDPQIQGRANQFMYYFRDGGYFYVAWNEKRGTADTLFTDKRVRQAMTLLTDRARIVRDVFRGYAKPAVGPFGVASNQNDPAIAPWPYDVDRAKALLADAGFKSKNDQGVLTDAAGREFRFKLAYSSKNPLSEKMVLLMKDSLARVGIVLEQEPSDWPIMIQKLNHRDFDAVMLGWSGGVETDIYQMFHSSQIADGADDFMSYANPALDKLIESARQTVDESKRMPLWRQAHAILYEDQPYTFLVISQYLQFIDKRIQNVELTKSGLNYFPDDTLPIPWYVPADRQLHKD